MDFTINRFKGSVPRLADHLGQKTGASLAIDCDFSSGCLDSFREPSPYRTVAEGTKATFQHECCWHDFKGCVDMSYGSVTCKQAFVTGVEDYPLVLTVSTDDEGNCVTKTRRLGLPCPHTAPSVYVSDLNDSAEKDIDGRSYCYQYVNEAGERSQLSPGSQAINMRDGQTAVISGWPVPEEEYGIVKVAIFRAVAAYQKGNESSNTSEAAWMFVGETDVNAVSYTDKAWNADLAIASQDAVVLPPPDGLRGIVWVESMNCLFGFVGNRIYASENNQYHNWPHYYDLDDNVCGLVESNGIIYVATDGRPYVISGVANCTNAGTRKIVRLPGHLPMVGCGNRRMAKCRAGAVYPSHKGLVLLSGERPPVLLTWPLYSDKDWQALRPQTITPVEVDGKLYVFGEGGSFYMQMSSGPETGWDLDFHCSLSDTGVTDAFVSRQGDFYIVKNGIQYLWNRGAKKRPHVFRSVEAVAQSPVGWGAGHLYFTGGTEKIKIELDGRTVLDRDVLSSRVFRLPMYSAGTRMFVTLSGTGRVSLVSIATAMHDLRSS